VNPTFKKIDTETLESWQQDGNTKGRRISRTSKLNAQRKISAMMLSEMRHTLRFIEEYNMGPNIRDSKENVLDREDVDNGKEDEEIVSRSDISKLSSKPPHATTDGRRSRSRKISGEHATSKTPPESQSRAFEGRITRSKGHLKTAQKTYSEESSDDEIEITNDSTAFEEPASIKLNWVPLSHIGLVSDYEGLQRKSQSFYPLPAHDTRESLMKSIKEIIDDDDGNGSSDEEALLEDKAHVRIVKGYNGKADQERLEKNEHEEQRKNKLRKHEYMMRGKKATPEDKELARLETHPFYFATQGETPRGTRKPCKYGKDCFMCRPVEQDDQPTPADASSGTAPAIYNPRFRRVDLDEVDDVAGQLEEHSRNGKSHRRSRTAELNSQRKESVKKLKELYHTLAFLEKYNTGLINTPGKSKKSRGQHRPLLPSSVIPLL
jgi:hypothetical protein